MAKTTNYKFEGIDLSTGEKILEVKFTKEGKALGSPKYFEPTKNPSTYQDGRRDRSPPRGDKEANQAYRVPLKDSQERSKFPYKAAQRAPPSGARAHSSPAIPRGSKGEAATQVKSQMNQPRFTPATAEFLQNAANYDGSNAPEVLNTIYKRQLGDVNDPNYDKTLRTLQNIRNEVNQEIFTSIQSELQQMELSEEPNDQKFVRLREFIRESHRITDQSLRDRLLKLIASSTSRLSNHENEMRKQADYQFMQNAQTYLNTVLNTPVTSQDDKDYRLAAISDMRRRLITINDATSKNLLKAFDEAQRAYEITPIQSHRPEPDEIQAEWNILKHLIESDILTPEEKNSEIDDLKTKIIPYSDISPFKEILNEMSNLTTPPPDVEFDEEEDLAKSKKAQLEELQKEKLDDTAYHLKLINLLGQPGGDDITHSLIQNELDKIRTKREQAAAESSERQKFLAFKSDFQREITGMDPDVRALKDMLISIQSFTNIPSSERKAFEDNLIRQIDALDNPPKADIQTARDHIEKIKSDYKSNFFDQDTLISKLRKAKAALVRHIEDPQVNELYNELTNTINTEESINRLGKLPNINQYYDILSNILDNDGRFTSQHRRQLLDLIDQASPYATTDRRAENLILEARKTLNAFLPHMVMNDSEMEDAPPPQPPTQTPNPPTAPPPIQTPTQASNPPSQNPNPPPQNPNPPAPQNSYRNWLTESNTPKIRNWLTEPSTNQPTPQQPMPQQTIPQQPMPQQPMPQQPIPSHNVNPPQQIPTPQNDLASTLHNVSQEEQLASNAVNEGFRDLETLIDNLEETINLEERDPVIQEAMEAVESTLPEIKDSLEDLRRYTQDLQEDHGKLELKNPNTIQSSEIEEANLTAEMVRTQREIVTSQIAEALENTTIILNRRTRAGPSRTEPRLLKKRAYYYDSDEDDEDDYIDEKRAKIDIPSFPPFDTLPPPNPKRLDVDRLIEILNRTDIPQIERDRLLREEIEMERDREEALADEIREREAENDIMNDVRIEEELEEERRQEEERQELEKQIRLQKVARLREEARQRHLQRKTNLELLEAERERLAQEDLAMDMDRENALAEENNLQNTLGDVLNNIADMGVEESIRSDLEEQQRQMAEEQRLIAERAELEKQKRLEKVAKLKEAIQNMKKTPIYNDEDFYSGLEQTTQEETARQLAQEAEQIKQRKAEEKLANERRRREIEEMEKVKRNIESDKQLGSSYEPQYRQWNAMTDAQKDRYIHETGEAVDNLTSLYPPNGQEQTPPSQENQTTPPQENQEPVEPERSREEQEELDAAVASIVGIHPAYPKRFHPPTEQVDMSDLAEWFKEKEKRDRFKQEDEDFAEWLKNERIRQEQRAKDRAEHNAMLNEKYRREKEERHADFISNYPERPPPTHPIPPAHKTKDRTRDRSPRSERTDREHSPPPRRRREWKRTPTGEHATNGPPPTGPTPGTSGYKPPPRSTTPPPQPPPREKRAEDFVNELKNPSRFPTQQPSSGNRSNNVFGDLIITPDLQNEANENNWLERQSKTPVIKLPRGRDIATIGLPGSIATKDGALTIYANSNGGQPIFRYIWIPKRYMEKHPLRSGNEQAYFEHILDRYEKERTPLNDPKRVYNAPIILGSDFMPTNAWQPLKRYLYNLEVYNDSRDVKDLPNIMNKKGKQTPNLLEIVQSLLTE